MRSMLIGGSAKQSQAGSELSDEHPGAADSRGVVGQVEEETHVVHGAVLLEVRLEEASRLHVHLRHVTGSEPGQYRGAAASTEINSDHFSPEKSVCHI